MTQSAQQQAADQQAAWQANLAAQLSGVTLPELQMLMGPGGQISGLLQATQGGTVKSPLDEKVYQDALAQLTSGYGQAGRTSAESIGYQALRSGEAQRSPGAVSSAIGSAATSLDRDRQSALRNLEFMSAQSSLTDYNKLLQLMGQGSQTALGLAQGFSGAAGSAIGGLSQSNPWGSALGGAAGGALSGAAVGSVVPGLGTLAGAGIGAVVGGLGGYFGGGG